MAGGVLLTGGTSRRLGADKASVVVDGSTLAERAAATLTEVCDPCVEAGPGRSGLFSVREVPPGSGPLAGLVAGWQALRLEFGHHGPVVAFAVDMPRVTPALLELLVSTPAPDGTSVVPEAGGRLQPLCARYAPEALEAAEALTMAGEASMHALLDKVPVSLLSEAAWSEVAPADAFDDIDTPGDLEGLR